MKEQILSCLYEIIKPWASSSIAYVHKNNVSYAKNHLSKNGLEWVKVLSMKSFPYI